VKLFIELYLDEDVSVLLAKLLNARGFNVTTAHESSMLGRDDSEQLLKAISQMRCILTHNREHFERLHRHYIETSQKHYGIIIAKRRNIYEIMSRVVILLNKITADEMENNLLYI